MAKTSRKILANIILHQGRVYKNSVLEIGEDNSVTVLPFDGETAATTFISGIVAVCNANAINEELVRLLKKESALFRNTLADNLTSVGVKINDILEKHNVWCSLADIPEIVEL